MARTIKNYEELKREKARLETLLKEQRSNLEIDIKELKSEVTPAIDLFSFTGKLTTHSTEHPWVNTIADMVIARIFARSPFLVWLIFPTLLSNLSSHYTPRLLHELQKLVLKKLKPDPEGDDSEKPQLVQETPQENGHKEEEKAYL